MRMFVHVGVYIEFGLEYWSLECRDLTWPFVLIPRISNFMWSRTVDDSLFYVHSRLKCDSVAAIVCTAAVQMYSVTLLVIDGCTAKQVIHIGYLSASEPAKHHDQPIILISIASINAKANVV